MIPQGTLQFVLTMIGGFIIMDILIIMLVTGISLHDIIEIFFKKLL
jgi:hypothetical protein